MKLLVEDRGIFLETTWLSWSFLETTWSLQFLMKTF